MAAFQFPNPTEQTTVTNPITGSTYQWKEPPGKWVVTVKMRDTGDIIWEGDSPPNPIGDYKLWYSTDTLELYFHYCDAAGTCAWVPTSAPITMLEDLDEGLFEVRQLLNQVNSAAITNENEITLIRESLGKVNLQEVLDNGNTADKGAEFGGTVKVKAKDTTADGDPLFTIEGDQANDGTGDNLLVARRHSNQGDQVRYYGPVVNDKEVTTKEYVDEIDDLQTAAISELQGSVLVLQQEIEQLSQLQDTGKWVYNGNGATPRQGQFTLSTTQGIPATTWGDAVKIIVDETDVGMGNHTFDSWEEDDTIEIFNTATNTYALYTLGNPAQVGFALKDLQRSKGLPINNAEYEIRVFKLESGIDLETADERYVQKTGDTMSGVLETTRPIWIRPGSGAAKGVNNMLVVNQVNPGPGGGSIARFQQDGEDVIKVQVDRVTSFQGNRIEKVGDPTADKDAANKEYVDKKVKKDGDTMTGHLKVTNPSKTDGTYLFSVDAEGLDADKKVAFRVTADGKVKAGHDTTHPFIATAANDVVTKKALDDAIGDIDLDAGSSYLPLSGGTMTGQLDMGNQWISHVRRPTATHEATNKEYVDDRVSEKIKMSDTAYPILWQYKEGVSATALKDGQFTILDKGGTTHVVDVFFAEKDAYGRKVWQSNGNSSYSHELGHQMMSIRDYMDICFQGKTIRWYMEEANSTSHIYTQYGKFNYDLINNKVYMIYIPGIMPAYRFPASWYNGQGKVPTVASFELPEEKGEPLDTFYPGDDATPAEDTDTSSSGY